MKSSQMKIANQRVGTGVSRSESFKIQHEANKKHELYGYTQRQKSIQKGIQEGNVSEGEIEVSIDNLDFGMM